MGHLVSMLIGFFFMGLLLLLNGLYTSEIVNEPTYAIFLKNLAFFSYAVLIDLILFLALVVVAANFFPSLAINSLAFIGIFGFLLVPSYFADKYIVDKIIHPNGLFYFPVFKKSHEFIFGKKDDRP